MLSAMFVPSILNSIYQPKASQGGEGRLSGANEPPFESQKKKLSFNFKKKILFE